MKMLLMRLKRWYRAQKAHRHPYWPLPYWLARLRWWWRVERPHRQRVQREQCQALEKQLKEIGTRSKATARAMKAMMAGIGGVRHALLLMTDPLTMDKLGGTTNV